MVESNPVYQDTSIRTSSSNTFFIRRVLTVISVVLVISGMFGSGYIFGKILTLKNISQQLAQGNVKGETAEKSYPLLQYSFPELSRRGGVAGEFKVIRSLEKTAEYTSYVFQYTSDGRKISGQMNIPASVSSDQKAPVIVMLRGFVPAEEYTIGQGSRTTAAFLAKNGYITIAPDFLGFGESDPPPRETLAERFVKPMNIMDLLATIESFEDGQISFQSKPIAAIDSNRLGLWAHSNGGQIGLSVLEITGRPIPFAMWAPVTKPFPYSVLFFTDEYEDKGKGLRALLYEFETDYNIEEFSIGYGLERVTSKIQLHQGTADDAVPQSWSDDFYSFFAGKGKKDQIEYFLYSGGNHGLYPEIELAQSRTVEFLDREVKNKLPEPSATPTASPTLTPSSTPTATISATIIPVETQTATNSGFLPPPKEVR